ncbi:hypothetical protein [Methyloglobulus sp.]|uniref:hypothetical protein n=1 Tax=Methyloglobulus sp. TaxID=2518622 RepID=UPI0032B7FCB7
MKTINVWLNLIALPSLLSACGFKAIRLTTVGPDYHSPIPSTPSRWYAKQSTTNDSLTTYRSNLSQGYS